MINKKEIENILQEWFNSLEPEQDSTDTSTMEFEFTIRIPILYQQEIEKYQQKAMLEMATYLYDNNHAT